MAEIKSPLRYPGGKSRAVQLIEQYLLSDFEEYREPFVGGGSLFIYLKQKQPDLKIWINDINRELYYFWKHTQFNSEKLALEVKRLKNKRKNGHRLFNELINANVNNLTGFERAVRFFVLNRITFSGVVESGGYSQLAFEARFTDSSIDRLAKLGQLLQGVRITNKDYRELLNGDGKGVLIFLDPPYFKNAKSKLYGKSGALHTNFNHNEFAQEMKNCKHSWLITYDDSPEIWNNFSHFAEISKWELQYGMNNYKQDKADKGSELFIANYNF